MAVVAMSENSDDVHFTCCFSKVQPQKLCTPLETPPLTGALFEFLEKVQAIEHDLLARFLYLACQENFVEYRINLSKSCISVSATLNFRAVMLPCSSLECTRPLTL